MNTKNWKSAADHFISKEKEFHLGFLVTESSHASTKNLSEIIQNDTAAGVSQLLKVDTDISTAYPRCINSSRLNKFKESIESSLLSKNRIIFSGCGSTGRLAVLLESLWRKGCSRLADVLSKTDINSETVKILRSSAEGVRGIITGGDRALIKSVENFEDYQEFGRQQVRELNLKRGDVFIAVSEGGETSSVIGSAHEAVSAGCSTFFLFNNPESLLLERIERSKTLIENPKVTSIDLTTGPMAVSGSTRMQATTMELLVIGSIMETALLHVLIDNTDGELSSQFPLATLDNYAEAFTILIQTLSQKNNTAVLASLIELEEKVYRENKMILYTADEFLLDIFTDTTERTPTFSIPPFRSIFSPDTPAPWAAALHPLKDTAETWYEMIGREPEGLDWNQILYTKMGAPHLAKNPPKLDREEIYSYKIGTDGFELYKKETSALIHIIFTSGSEISVSEDTYAEKPESRYQLVISSSQKAADKENSRNFFLSLPLPDTPLQLFSHLAAKIIFNTVSTGTMARMGRIKGNWMIEVTPSNKKLIDRSIRIISDLKSLSYKEAAYLIFKEIEKKPEDLSSLVARLLD